MNGHKTIVSGVQFTEVDRLFPRIYNRVECRWETNKVQLLECGRCGSLTIQPERHAQAHTKGNI